jgi:hypothetical protein
MEVIEMVNLSFKGCVSFILNLVCSYVIIIFLLACGDSTSDETPDDTPDTLAPIIQLNGESEVTLILGETYVELGATASDDRDTNVTVEISGSVDSSTLGTYTITYSATDSANNSSQLNRLIHVVSPDSAEVVYELSSTTWRSNCNFVEQGHPENEEDTYQFGEQRFNSSANSVELDVYIYEPQNNTCSGQASYIYSATYDITFGSQIITDSGQEAYEIDFDLTSESVPNSWPANVLDIIHRNGNVLYLGVESDDNSRPTALDFDNYTTLVE